MIVHADFVHGMQSGPIIVWGHLATNPAAIGTTRKPPERSSRLNIAQKQCRLQVHPTVLYRSALSDGCPHHLSGRCLSTSTMGQRPGAISPLQLDTCTEGAPRLEGGRGFIPKQPSVRSQAPTITRIAPGTYGA